MGTHNTDLNKSVSLLLRLGGTEAALSADVSRCAYPEPSQGEGFNGRTLAKMADVPDNAPEREFFKLLSSWTFTSQDNIVDSGLGVL